MSRILIVEDEVAIADLGKDYLELSGFEVEIENDGTKGLERALHEEYDLKELKDMIGFGGSPRASINLALAARTYAFIKRRGYVIPEDVRAVAHDVLRHRIGLTYEAEASNLTSDEIISKILNKVEVP